MGIGSILGTGIDFLTGGSGIGSAIGGWLDSESDTNSANKFNVQQAQANRDFQERMSSTSYQRGVKDMQAAGLNPMLAYSQGGASSPGGSTTAPAVLRSTSASQGASADAASQQVLQSKAQMDLISAQADKLRSETMDQKVNTAMLLAQIREMQMRGARTEEEIPGVRGRSQADLMKSLVEQGAAGYEHTGFFADVQRRKAEARLSELELPKSRAEADFYEKIKSAPWFLKLLGEGFGTAVGVKRAIQGR